MLLEKDKPQGWLQYWRRASRGTTVDLYYKQVFYIIYSKMDSQGLSTFKFHCQQRAMSRGNWALEEKPEILIIRKRRPQHSTAHPGNHMTTKQDLCRIPTLPPCSLCQLRTEDILNPQREKTQVLVICTNICAMYAYNVYIDIHTHKDPRKTSKQNPRKSSEHKRAAVAELRGTVAWRKSEGGAVHIKPELQQTPSPAHGCPLPALSLDTVTDSCFVMYTNTVSL